MPKAAEVAIALRKLADHFDQHADTEIITPELFFNHLGGTKESFLASVSILPRPLKKDYGEENDQHAFLKVMHEAHNLDVRCLTYRSTVCKLVTPARGPVWECEPLLSADEEKSLTSAE